MKPSLTISPSLSLPLDEIEWQGVRAQGSGGQNVNKVSSAVHLFFPIEASSLPEDVKAALLRLSDHRITASGTIVIKAQLHRSQGKNHQEALQQLQELIKRATKRPKKRYSTKPSKRARARRMDEKTKRSQTKNLRGKIDQ